MYRVRAVLAAVAMAKAHKPGDMMFDFGGHGSSGESEGEADSDSSSDSENPEGGVGVDADADVTGLKRKRSRFPGGDADVVKEDNRGASPPPPRFQAV